MLFRSFSAFFIFIAGIFCAQASQCTDIYSNTHSLSANGGKAIAKGNSCNGGSCSYIPTFSLITPFPTLSPSTSFTSSSIVDGSFEYTSWGLPKESVVSFSGSGTAVLYFNGSITIPKDTRINSGGSAANVMIIVNGAISIAKDANISAFIYATGSISLAKDSNYNGAISAGGALVSSKNNTFTFNPSDVDKIESDGFCNDNSPTIHHFEINHDGQGLTCLAEPLTIKACSDAACTNTTSTPTDVQIFANGVLKETVTVTGETSTSFNHLVAENITLSSDKTYTCKNGISTSCDINFDNAGFLLDVNSGADVSSCGSVNFDIKAVKLSDTGVSCAPAFTGGQALDFSFSYSNPTTGTKLPLLNATNMASSGQIQTRTVTFDVNGEAILPIKYNDAGSLNFTVSENVSSGVSSSSISKDFYPSKIALTAKKIDGTLLNNAASSGEPKQIAASNFDLSYVGQCSDDTETPNYQPQSTNTVELAVRHLSPSSSSSVLGKLKVDAATINASNSSGTNWQAINTANKQLTASYDEVGIISINLRDNDYLGNTINASAFNTVGRFYPSYFDVSVTDNSFENACSIGVPSFTYVGQSFSYLNAPIITITAKNALGVTTQNYTETSFQKIIENNINRTFPVIDSVKNGMDNLTKMGVESSTQAGSLAKLSNGVLEYEFSASDNFTYSKNANSKVQEFQVNYDILINSITDSDGVAINSGISTPILVQPSGGLQRFGRLVLGNSFGPETSSLSQYFKVEYLNSSGVFELNADDNCSLITKTASSWSFSNPTNNVTIGALSISGIDSSLNNGEFQGILLSSGNNQGSIDIEYTTQDWLKYNWSNKVSNLHDENAKAKATFGVYRGNDRIISWREVGN